MKMKKILWKIWWRRNCLATK